jgi:hypothetical protein
MIHNRRVIFLIAVVLVASLVLAIIYRDFIRDNVLIPILYLFWYIRLFLSSLGEVCLWPIALLIMVFISLFVLRKRKNSLFEDRRYSEAHDHVEEGRVAFWMKYIRRQSLGAENLGFASFRMKELVLSVLAYQENLTNAELEAEIGQGQVQIPEDLRNILQWADQTSKPMTKPASLKSKYLRWFQSRTNSNQSYANPEIYKLVRYLEAQLEIDHDDGNNQSSIPV